MNKWISVKDKLPDIVVEVLGYSAITFEFAVVKRCYDFGPYDDTADWSWYDSEYTYPITHWMPLPDPPKEND